MPAKARHPETTDLISYKRHLNIPNMWYAWGRVEEKSKPKEVPYFLSLRQGGFSGSCFAGQMSQRSKARFSVGLEPDW